MGQPATGQKFIQSISRVVCGLSYAAYILHCMLGLFSVKITLFVGSQCLHKISLWRKKPPRRSKSCVSLTRTFPVKCLLLLFFWQISFFPSGKIFAPLASIGIFHLALLCIYRFCETDILYRKKSFMKVIFRKKTRYNKFKLSSSIVKD